MKKKIEKQLSGLSEPFVALLIPAPSQQLQTYIDLIEHGTNKNMKGICITLTRTVDSLLEILDQKNINTENLHFIDCISRISGADTSHENCEYVSHPSNLTDISIAVNNSLKTVEGKNSFWITDSWSSFLIYNDEKEVLRFTILVINRFRSHGVNGLLLSMGEESYQPFNNKISAFCDKVIDLQ